MSINGLGAGGGIQQIMAMRQQLIDKSQVLQQLHTPGSPEVSAEDPTIKERDPMDVDAVTVSEDGKTVFLKIADLKPVMQQKIQMKLKGADGKDVNYSVFHTINKLGPPSGDATAAAAGAGAGAGK